MLPIIDLSGSDDAIASAIADACRSVGFFYVRNHGVPAERLSVLDRAARAFFALPDASKREIEMAKGGLAWRGFFGVGDELTSGQPDQKEGLYFGAERTPDGRPLFGRNLFPTQVPAMREALLEYLESMTELGHRLMAHVARSLGLPAAYFFDRYTADPLILFRIFHYPALVSDEQWSVGEHSDYGLLTILAQDDAGGLQVKAPDGWIEAPPIDGTFVVNLGDMLDRLTNGLYRSTHHRVRNTSGRSRLSFPFFFDPNVDARIEPLPATDVLDDAHTRWDGESVRAFEGTYGDYIQSKISKVFPALVGW